MELLYCNKCNNVFDKYKLKIYKKHTFCPTAGCTNSLANIDEFIAYAVVQFNKLGYTTTASCQGHYLENFGLRDRLVYKPRKTFIIFDNNLSDLLSKRLIQTVHKNDRIHVQKDDFFCLWGAVRSIEDIMLNIAALKFIIKQLEKEGSDD